MCAEGGTGADHSEVIFRGKSPWGPFEPYKGNPILTQRDLPADRANPVTNAGHADLVEMKDGSWWAVFLASRPYAGLPLQHRARDIPVAGHVEERLAGHSRAGQAHSLRGQGPARHDACERAHDALSGNFTKRDEFDMARSGPEWLQVHVPKQSRFEFMGGYLRVRPLPVNLDERRNASFLARRQQHLNFDASTSLKSPAGWRRYPPGLAAYQSEKYWYFFGVRRVGNALQVFLERNAGKGPQIVTGTSIRRRAVAAAAHQRRWPQLLFLLRRRPGMETVARE